MKSKTSIKAGGAVLPNHNEKIGRVENVAKNNAGRKESRRSDRFGIKVMNIRTGIKAGWVSRNHK